MAMGYKDRSLIVDEIEGLFLDAVINHCFTDAEMNI
jgi:hypothetical protein